MNNFASLTYWFDVKPLPFIKIFYLVLLAICLAFIVLGIISTLLRKKKFKKNILADRTWYKVGSWSYSFGIVGLILIFLKSQRVPFLGMRIWFALWLLTFFVWLVFILKYLIIKVPKMKKEIKEKKEFEKYLP